MIPETWLSGRFELFPSLRNGCYLDHAGVAPMSGPAATTMARVAHSCAETEKGAYPNLVGAAETARERISDLLGTYPGQVAYIPNTSTGISLAAFGIDWQPGDQVVLAEGEFPANVYPWLHLQRLGVEIIDWRLGETNEQALDNLEVLLANADRVRMVAFSWAQFHTGRLLPVADIAPLTGDDILTVVDGIQALGIVPCEFERWGIDVLVADGHKWLLGPEGLGVAAFSKKAIEKLQPAIVGWHTVSDRMDFDNINWQPAENAGKFEAGTWNVAGILALDASVELLLDAGIFAIREQTRDLTEYLHHQFDIPLPTWPLASHTFVPCPDGFSAGAVTDQGIACAVRGGRLRLSPHAYQTKEELKQAAEKIHKALGR